MKKTKILIIVILLSILILELIFNGLVRFAPSFFCDYIEYNGIKYYPVAEHVSAGAIKGEDSKKHVRLFKNNGLRIGIFKKFYAYEVDNDREEKFLVFDSEAYTNDLSLTDLARN